MILDQDLAEQDTALPLEQRLQAAKKIGGKYGLITGVLGVLSIQLLVTLRYGFEGYWVDSFAWLDDGRMTVFLLISIAAVVVFNYTYGRIAGRQILINRRNHKMVGIVTSLATLVSGSLVLAVLVVVGEGDSFELLYLVPILITMGGAVPAIIGGLLMGYAVYRRGQKQEII